MRPSSAPRFRRRGQLEALEPRYVLAAAGTAVGDALFTLYDGAVISTLPTDFSRDVPTINGLGEEVGVDERRFGEPIHYSPVTQWTETDVQLSTGLTTMIGSGWDHDGATPLMLLLDQTYNRLTFFRGEDFEVANVRQYTNNDMMLGAMAGERFAPRAAIIHHGLVVIATERSVLTDGVYELVGIDFFATQDYGVTMERIPVAGGGFGLPVLEQTQGLHRLHTWSFKNPFPVDGIDDSRAAWFPWADYIHKTGAPKGGQVGLFRADRPPGSDLWVIRPNRVIYSQWVDEDAGGLHAHTAAVTTGGLISHWGDVGYRNQAVFHHFDLENYETAPVESKVVYGGYSPTPTAYSIAPQPVSAAPSPEPGEHFAGGDETPDHVLSFGALADLEDRLSVEAVVYKPAIDTPGGVHAGAFVSQLHWLQGVGYVGSSVDDNHYYFSPDGERWTELNRPPSNVPAVLLLYGDRLLAKSDGKLWTADLPTIETVRPLQLAPGGKNELAISPEWRQDPEGANAARRVIYSEGAWRYQDTLEPLEAQAPAPAFSPSAWVYEVSIETLSSDLGSLWLQPPTESSPVEGPHVTEMWVANLGQQGVTFGANQGAVDESSGVSAFSFTTHFEVNDNTQWIPVGVSTQASGEGEGRYASELRSYYSSPGARFLVAIPYFGEGVASTYPLAPQATGSDELEMIDTPSLGDSWSLGMVAHWPENAPIDSRSRMPIASLSGPDGDAIELSLAYTTYWTELYLDAYLDGELTESLLLRSRYPEDIMRGDWFEILVSSGDTTRVSFAIGGGTTQVVESAAIGALSLSQFAWADRHGDVLVAIDPILMVVDDLAWRADQHVQWHGSSLQQKVLFASRSGQGDFNRDGLVNAGDYSIWRDTLYDATPGRPGDANLDGVIDNADRVVWAEQYGQAGSKLTTDFNRDGVVNAADYTVWRDLLALQVEPGSGADADANGFVEPADFVFWQSAYGASYPTLESLRSAAELTRAIDEPHIDITESASDPIAASRIAFASGQTMGSKLAHHRLDRAPASTLHVAAIVKNALLLDEAMTSDVDSLVESDESMSLAANEVGGCQRSVDEGFALLDTWDSPVF